MDVEAIRIELGVGKSELARKLGVSPGHITDLLTKRRPLSLKLAAKLEALTGRPLVAEVVRERVG